MIVSKAVNMAKKMDIPILGLVENMSYLECPDCGKLNHIRTATADEGRAFQARKLEDVWRDVAPVLAG